MRRSLIIVFIFKYSLLFSQNNILVFQSDFGLKDGAVAAMKGVAMGVSPQLKIFDITHEIPAYNIWESAYRLDQAAPYWPAGTVFVSIVDPGVGSSRRSVVLRTKNNLFFVGPDNGQFTLIAQHFGIAAIHEINETINRRKGSEASYTFHGRDVYAYTGARLAARIISLNGVGKKLTDSVTTIHFQQPVFEKGEIRGNIPILDIQYGNIWTNIDANTFKKLGLHYGEQVQVEIFHDSEKIYSAEMSYMTTFSEVETGKPLCYLNSLLNVSFALNMENFSETYKVYSGPDWSVMIRKK